MKRAGFVVAAAAFALSACTSIPKQNLDAYVGNFNSAKATAVDLYLAAQLRAEKLNDGSASGRAELAKKGRMLSARVAAFDVIDQYNRALVKLATGTGAAPVKGELEGLSSNLKSFGIDKLSVLVASAAPYLSVISQAISLIDNAIKAERFADAVDAAQRPVQEIIGILVLDATDLEEVKNRPLKKSRDRTLGKLDDAYFSFAAVVNGVKPHQNLSASIAAFNTSLSTLEKDGFSGPGPLVHAPKNDATDVNEDKKALLQTIRGQAIALIEESNRAGATIKAQAALIEEYKKTLEACSSSFKELNAAVRDGRRVGTLALAVNVLNLRKAYVAVQEAK